MSCLRITSAILHADGSGVGNLDHLVLRIDSGAGIGEDTLGDAARDAAIEQLHDIVFGASLAAGALEDIAIHARWPNTLMMSALRRLPTFCSM